jgi:ActR/RegA family two-component response regulator
MANDVPLLAVVDDDADARVALTRLVSSADFAVETFASGAEFLRSVTDHEPDCVVLDLHMPQMREMAQDALATLYEIAPGTRRIVERSAGYAVFSTSGFKLFFAGGSAAVSPGVYLYQPTHTGPSATLTVGGTKFLKDADLN